MNYADSERIRFVFKTFKIKETKRIVEASYIVFNSCAVRQKAEQKLLGYGTQIKKLNQQNKYPKVILTGCMVKQGLQGKLRGKDVSKQHNMLLRQASWIDFAVPIQSVFEKLEVILKEDTGLDISHNPQSKDYLSISASAYSKIQASVPISFGCNHFCSYCIVPYSRGEENFREYKQIQKEYKDYVSKEYKKITLLGQTVNKWLNPNYKYDSKAYGWYRMSEILPQALDNQVKEPQNFLELIKSLT